MRKILAVFLTCLYSGRAALPAAEEAAAAIRALPHPQEQGASHPVKNGI